jgi:ribonuclease P protein component
MRELRPAHAIGRLTKRSDFVAAASGRRFRTERMTVQSRRRDDAETNSGGLRIGFTVTRKVGHATERNRIRRRLRTACRIAAADFSDAGLDLVVVARREALCADWSALVDDLSRALHVLTKNSGPRPGGAVSPDSGKSGSPHARG